MSLAQLLFPPPTDSGLEEWAFEHNAHHQAIIDAVRQTRGVELQLQQIYPLNVADIENWLQLHQSMHNQMCALFNIISNDLSSVDWRDANQREGFFFLNYSNHRDVGIACGAPI